MRNLIFIFFLFFSLTGCGSKGGGDSTSPPVVPPVQNPLNGIWTFANGVQLNKNADSTNRQEICTRLDLSTWAFPATNPLAYGYSLRNPTAPSYATNVSCNIGFNLTYVKDSAIGGVVRMTVDYPGDGPFPEDATWGPPDQYWLATALDGGIYMLKFQGGGSDRNDFDITTAAGSPRIFLPPSKHVGNNWVGGMLGKSTMTIEAVNVTSPGLIPGCYKISERFTDGPTGRSISIDWWYLPGSGFVDRYSLDTQRLYSRTPFSNG